MKKFLENFYIIFFIIVIFGFLIFSIIEKDKVFSDYENRALQTFPKASLSSILNGNFQKEFEDYCSDQLFLKNKFVRGKTYLEICQLKFSINNIYRAKDNFYIERHSIANIDLNLLNNNVNELLKFKEKYNAEIYLVPKANEFLSEKLYYSNDIDYNKYMSKIDNIYYVNNILSDYIGDIDDLYYKTDHHWTTIGAYQLYKNIVENPVELNLEEVSSSFLGTIHNKLNINMKPDIIYKQKSNTNFRVYYDLNNKNKEMYNEDYLDKKDKYAYFLDSNHGLVQIINEDINSNEKILIIKDSYANCFIPFIAENYKQIDVIDYRYLNIGLSKYFELFNDYSRIIFLYNKDSFATSYDLNKLNL